MDQATKSGGSPAALDFRTRLGERSMDPVGGPGLVPDYTYNIPRVRTVSDKRVNGRKLDTLKSVLEEGQNGGPISQTTQRHEPSEDTDQSRLRDKEGYSDTLRWYPGIRPHAERSYLLNVELCIIAGGSRVWGDVRENGKDKSVWGFGNCQNGI